MRRVDRSSHDLATAPEEVVAAGLPLDLAAGRFGQATPRKEEQDAKVQFVRLGDGRANHLRDLFRREARNVLPLDLLRDGQPLLLVDHDRECRSRSRAARDGPPARSTRCLAGDDSPPG